ncbi:Methyltransferase type 11 [Parvibaculum lavamentivorans DS-1]|uniref:Methyltransferase type 11 n=1 Tax=Parvibaculum lavamentivorans (strain DS-1 / DSM 13023 / NCIMB 13966) TaxID=402881 RepID=A7HV96_PARL1|nr:class I SAM-dependent methyltransferase [Parvibaculum lavamentivorans]ABS63829.1 Methyltransferase type 11 [Parvibaculum lavamentivorans DS-1]
MSVSPQTIAATGPNAEQIDYWNGDAGDKWAQNRDRLDAMLQPFSEAVLRLASAKPGERVLDIGCGCGATTFELAAQAGSALGVDISAPMVARARERAAALKSPAEFALADAATHPFAPASFDILASRFGIMFFLEPVPAFAHLRQALAPGGRIAFVCWRPLKENAWVSVPLFAALPHLPAPEPATPGAPGPFAFDDPERFRRVLTEAGFGSIAIEPHDALLSMSGEGDPVETALRQTLEIGPLARLLKEQEEAPRRRAVDAVREALARHVKDGKVRLGGAVWLVTARA